MHLWCHAGEQFEGEQKQVQVSEVRVSGIGVKF